MGHEDAPSDLEVRATGSIDRAGDWSLVLHSAAIGHRLDIRESRIVLSVSPDDQAAARAALDAFDAESVPVVDAPAPDLGPSPLGLACALILIALHLAAGARDDVDASVWFAAGSASAAAIVDGEWWRATTAIMLHADVLHLAGNVLAALVFVSAVGRWLGAGLGGAVILTSATAANLLTAWFYQTRHVSIGASTATFAALGVLSGLQMVRRARHVERRGRAWFPLAAGLGLIVMLGSSERADLVAHLSGLGAGVIGGALVAASGVRAPGRVAQTLLGALTLAALVAAWSVAFRSM
jgi:rhomboid protease GluP